MNVYLYPNTSTQYSNCEKGTDITSPINTAADDLYNANSVTYYKISRFDAKDYSYPKVDTSSRSNIASEFESWLTDGSSTGNETGDNLKSYRGAHVLVHGDSCSTSTAGGEAHDKCTQGGTGFSRGVMAWTGTCSNTGLRKNSAIQETLHMFIRANKDKVNALFGDGDGDGDIDSYDEHTLGVIDAFDYVSPMLTYHADEFEAAGDCKRDSNITEGYRQAITTCTEDAVEYTSNDQCDPQSPCL